jgi:hypothetical protein
MSSKSTIESPKTEGQELKPPRLRLQFTAWLVILASFAVFCIIAFSAYNLVSDFFSRSVQKQNASLQITKGQNVFLRRNGQAPEIRANNNDQISMGDVIITDKESTVQLQFFDGTILEVLPNTQLEIKECRIVTSNFVRKEKNLAFEVNNPAQGSNQSAGIQIRPAPPTSPNFIGQAVRVTTPDGALIVFDDAAREGLFTVSVEHDAENLQRTLIKSATTSRASAKAYAENQALTITPGDRVQIERGKPPAELPDRIQQYITNGAFLNGLDYWTPLNGGNYANTRNKGMVIVDTEKVEDGTQTRLHIQRLAGEGETALQDGVENSITQDFRNTALFDYNSLELTVKLRIKRQSLPGGGQEGYEYPVFIKLFYIDKEGTKFQYFRGFYFRPNSNTTKTRDNLSDDSSSLRLKEDEWFEFKFDLATLPNKPERLSNIIVGASGHEYEVFFAEVSLIAKG